MPDDNAWTKSEIEGAKYPMRKSATLYRHDCPKCGHSVSLLHSGPVICDVCPMLAQQREKDAAIVERFKGGVQYASDDELLDAIIEEITDAA